MEKPTLQIVYKVCTRAEWLEAVSAGRFAGSADDRRDGFIHLSTAAQLPGTLARHFSDAGGRGRPDLVLAAFEADRLGPALKWEPARDGSLFPHLYVPLETGLASRVVPLPVGADGRHTLAAEVI